MLKMFKALVSLVALVCLPTMAAVINFDYIDSSGDGLAAYDDSTNLIWLDLSATAGLKQADALSQYNGFSVATSAQAFDLMQNFFDSGQDSITWYGLFGNSEYMGENSVCMVQVFCSYGASDDGSMFGYGVSSTDWMRFDGMFDGSGSTPGAIEASPVAWFLVADLTQLRALQSTNPGSGTVPEPTTLALFALTLLFLSVRRKNKA